MIKNLPDSTLTSELDALRDKNLLRTLPSALDRPGALARRAGKDWLQFSANDYLGLATHPVVIEGACQAARDAGCSATGSRLLSGNLSLHETLERELARLKKTETALLFNSGFAANTGMLSALAGEVDLLVCDKLNHASLIDGARQSGAQVRYYRHGHLDRARELLTAEGRDGRAYRRKFLVTDGVFSMDGDIVDLPEALKLCDESGARLILDDAHATGVIGPTGRGTFEHFGLHPDPRTIIMGTLGKALGGFGAFVACDAATRALLINHARPFVFSTALPPPVLGAALAALSVLRDEPQRLNLLRANIAHLRMVLRVAGLDVEDGYTPIVPIPVGDAGQALQLARDLEARGILALAVRPPTVPIGGSRLRVTVSADHTFSQIDQLAQALGNLWADRDNRGDAP